MFKKQKKPFWQLCIVFSVMAVLVLAISWAYPSENRASMDHSMAGMMKDEHLNQATIGDLFTLGTGEDQQRIVTVTPRTGDSAGHNGHHPQEGKLYTMHLIMTGLLVFSLPIILAGAVFLTIVWPKPSFGGRF